MGGDTHAACEYYTGVPLEPLKRDALGRQPACARDTVGTYRQPTAVGNGEVQCVSKRITALSHRV